jgi:hypothetical protein
MEVGQILSRERFTHLDNFLTHITPKKKKKKIQPKMIKLGTFE